ncbi:MAG: aspartyl/asparaginyl beta-hydroxylase domain-containing protein [Gammaproteobacteria bacterium]
MNEPTSPSAAELPAQIRQLEALGAELVRNQRHDDAERIFRELVNAAPLHVPALRYLAHRALLRKELDTAQTYIERAIRAAPRGAAMHQNLGIILRARGYLEGALMAFDTALELHPELAMAWIQRGEVLMALGRSEEAVASYLHAENRVGGLRAFAAASRESHGPQRAIRRALVQLARARIATVHTALAPLLRANPPTALDRIEPTIRHMCRAALPAYSDPLQRPAYAYVPGLDAHPFFERTDLPFLADLECKTDAIRHELRAVLAERKELAPYVQDPEGREGRWRELNYSSKWSSYHLYRSGERVAEHCTRCPATTAALEALPLVRMQGHAPEIFFSILEPHTHIPPHYGIANYKLAVHLPLVIPPHCSIRVGDQTRGWTPRKCLIFDDSFEHEAWNRSAEVRVVLILEVWHPSLKAVEREALSTAQSALARFNLKADALVEKRFATARLRPPAPEQSAART